MQPKLIAIRKRTQIASANRTMFFWVAGVSALFGVSLVAVIFLTQILLFNELVLYEKAVTVSNLDSNYKNITKKDGLQDNVRVLDTNQALIDSKSKPEDQAIQVILDALPSDANSLALGASLQDKLIFGINGLTLDSLQVDSVVGIETVTESSIAEVSTGVDQGQITFRFSVTGDEAALKNVLTNLEKSIRTIDIIFLRIENQGNTRVLTIQARAFYEPLRDVKLREKTVKLREKTVKK